MLTETLDLISASGPIRALRGSALFYPLISAAHIAGFALMIGAIATWDVAILRARTPDPLAQRLARNGAILAVLAGIVLFVCRGSSYVANPAFQLKMAFLALALGNVALTHRHPGQWTLRANAAASLALWSTTLLAGRYIGFV